jgi:hypothetical protein
MEDCKLNMLELRTNCVIRVVNGFLGRPWLKSQRFDWVTINDICLSYMQCSSTFKMTLVNLLDSFPTGSFSGFLSSLNCVSSSRHPCIVPARTPFIRRPC